MVCVYKSAHQQHQRKLDTERNVLNPPETMAKEVVRKAQNNKNVAPSNTEKSENGKKPEHGATLQRLCVDTPMTNGHSQSECVCVCGCHRHCHLDASLWQHLQHRLLTR